MPRPLRWIPPGQMVEITCRTLQGRAFLRPGDEANRRIVGVLGRAQRRSGLTIHAVTVLSNHYHLLATPRDAQQLATFMGFVQTNLAKELNRLHGWSGPVWARRYRSIPVDEDTECQEARLRYVLSNAVKEDLVERCTEWPGVHCARALLSGDPLRGVWYDRSGFAEARRRVGEATLEDHAEEETLVLTPLPCWSDLPDDEIRERLRFLIDSIEAEHRERRKREGRSVVGTEALRKGNPLQPTSVSGDRREATAAPLVHVRSAVRKRKLLDAYREFLVAFAAAAARLRGGEDRPRFPAGSFPPGLPFVPHPVSG